MTLGFPLLLDFDAGTGEVRLALIGAECGLGSNSDTTVTYRVDALSICQRIPAITSPSSGGLSGPSIGGTASPGATVHVYIDGGTTPACTATADASGHWTCTLSGVAAGPHSAVVTSTIVGATETAPAINFTLDLTPPAAPVITGPKPDSVLATSTPALSGTADPGSLVTVREGSTVLCTSTANDSGKWSCTPSTPLADGPHTVTATASNAAGSTSPVSNSVTFTTDTQAPDTTISHGPDSRTEDNAAAFGYTSNENSVRYECSLDGTAYAPCKDAYDVKPGEHTLRVRAVDAAGNVDATPAVYTWTVEDTRAFAGGGCSAAPASSWLALLGLLGLRRRNRR
ncbi:Ig-like domain-containing protein [Archangium violaceum]|uniref:Ig-like domain-containing protein n=1 Tax=Archangium violaceum TaxID=83451 RepID=UPI002B2E26FB|nr:Ig-like domain-containing protein [Archangium gephyra]